MKDFLNTLRFAFAILALPLAATAAVSAQQYFSENSPVSYSDDVVKAIPASTANAPTPAPLKKTLAGTFRNHTVSIDADGIVRGRVAIASDAEGVTGLGDMKVFFLKDGKIAHQTYTIEDGSFEAQNLESGNYSFVATGKNGFAAFGVSLSENGESTTNNLIEVATVSPNFAQLATIIDGRFPKTIVDQIVNNSSLPFDGPVTGSNRVQIIDGKIKGHLVSLNGTDNNNAEVRLSKGSELVAKTNVDENGSFSFANVQPGVYEFVSAGSEGIAALSFEAVQDGAVSVIEGGTGAVEAAPAGYVAQDLDVAPTMASDSTIVGEQFDFASTSYEYPSYYAGSEIGCGIATGGCCGGSGNWSGFSGGCGGGCGGFGGLGGGRLLTSGLLIWALIEAFNNNNNTPNPPSPSST
jgi:hypothetical protein